MKPSTAVMIFNYKYKFQKNNKHIFVPNAECLRYGEDIIRHCSDKIKFPNYFFHYANGGHVDALHQHLERKYFFRIDIQNFFYSISRNRVARALHSEGIFKFRKFAKWSCVKNPLGEPAYSIPIGFIQSPLLASLVFLHSPVTEAIEHARASGILISLYVDDLIGSGMDREALTDSYKNICDACRRASFPLNSGKLVSPESQLVAFNCDLNYGHAKVTDDRSKKFYATPSSLLAKQSFEAYCNWVASKNFP